MRRGVPLKVAISEWSDLLAAESAAGSCVGESSFHQKNERKVIDSQFVSFNPYCLDFDSKFSSARSAVKARCFRIVLNV